MSSILVSVLMTVYNDISILPLAIKSVQAQSVANWELLIMDNSDNNSKSWDLLSKFSKKDERIRIFKSPGNNGNINVGWAKGSSILLLYARGIYTTFLSADDILDEDAFEWIKIEYEKHNPDVIWVGNCWTKLEKGKLEISGYTETKYNVFDCADKIFEMMYVLHNIYYNSMFHFSKTEFLKIHNIDFFYPYPGDCASMTAVLCKSKKMVTLDKCTYYLTINTSQTKGKVTWEFDKMFSVQWMLLKSTLNLYNCKDMQIIKCLAKIVYHNFECNLKDMLNGAPIRDAYMNPMEVTYSDRLIQIRKIIFHPDIRELFELTDSASYLARLEKMVL